MIVVQLQASDKPGCHATLQEFENFARAVLGFAVLGIPAAIVNSGLKGMTSALQLSFQQRLNTYLHRMYTSNRAYYAASTLGGLTNADQRITEDVEKFCYSISELYSHTFKVGGVGFGLYCLNGVLFLWWW